MIFTDNISSCDNKWWIEQVEAISKHCMCDCRYQDNLCGIIFGPMCGAWDDLKESLEIKQ